MLNYQVRSSPVHEPPVASYLLTTNSSYNMEEPKSEYSLDDDLQMLASQASTQYLDLELESTENELAAWIRHANRGPQAVPVNGTTTPSKPYHNRLLARHHHSSLSP